MLIVYLALILTLARGLVEETRDTMRRVLRPREPVVAQGNDTDGSIEPGTPGGPLSGADEAPQDLEQC